MALFRNRFQGHCAAGDIFIFTMWCTSDAPLSDVHQAAIDWAETLWTGTGTLDGYATLTTGDVGMDSVQTAEIEQATGKQQFDESSDVTYTGSSTNPAMPADVAIVVTERTIVASGKGLGRFYLPQPHTDVTDSVGLLSDATRTTVADIVQAAYSGLQATAQPVVYSPTYRSVAAIERIEVGNHADTQRRRENALPVVRTKRDI